MARWDKLLKTLAGAGVGASLMTSEEAEGAGISTIAKKLGIGLEEAKKIKDLAKSKAPKDIFEENIKAVQTVSQYKKNPDKFTKIGSGSDVGAYEKQGQVLKVPHIVSYPEDTLDNAIFPALLDLEELGPKTKNIQTSEKLYQIQPKLDQINKRPPTSQEAERYDYISDELNRIRGDFSGKLPIEAQNKLADQEAKLLSEGDKLSSNRLQNISPEEIEQLFDDLHPLYRGSIHSLEDAKSFPDVLASQSAQQYVGQSNVGQMLSPKDIHEYNVGVDPSSRAIQVFDTSRFDNLQKEKLTPEMKQAVLKNYIADPSEKKRLSKYMDTDDMAKAAAIGAIPASDDLDLWEKTKEYGAAGLKHLSRPGAALRGATYAAQTDKPIWSAASQGFQEPETAPTGEQIAEATNLPDDNVLLKTAIGTSAEFLDPIDVVGLGAATKLGKLKHLLK